jgi:hydroxyethylthiazole kinase-like uncharacterized protein yjeF
MKILTAAEAREVDRLTTEDRNVPSLELMENAGRSVAAFIKAQYSDFLPRRVAVLCGKGNNGGDGFVIARHLAQMGIKPSVFLFAQSDQVKGGAAANLKRLQNELKVSSVPDETTWRALRPEIGAADIIVDALLGVIEMVNERDRIGVVGVDVPSGLDADSGAANGPVVFCDYTVTFTAPKTGFFLASADQYVGNLVLRHIGSPAGLIEEIGRERLRWSEPYEFESFAKPRKPSGHKGDYGHALVVAGSVGKSGAAVLASWAALRAGAGLVTVATSHRGDARTGAAFGRIAHTRGDDGATGSDACRNSFRRGTPRQPVHEVAGREAGPGCWSRIIHKCGDTAIRQGRNRLVSRATGHSRRGRSKCLCRSSCRITPRRSAFGRDPPPRRNGSVAGGNGESSAVRSPQSCA